MQSCFCQPNSQVENEAESEMELCGRCHLPTHKYLRFKKKNVHSHPPVSRTKACPEFGTLSCPRCLEWGHWEDSCWAIDHVCERWLLWEMKRLHWQWQVTFSDVVMLVTLRLFMMSRTSNRSATRSQIPFKQNCLPPALWRVFTLVHAEKSHCGHSWLGAVPRLVLRSDL